MPMAPNTDETKYVDLLALLRQEGVVITKGESIRTLAASDMAVVASGTATFQTALLEVPMLVIYKLSPFTYHLGKHILNVKHISLVNILAGHEVVKEFIQERANAQEIMQELMRIVSDAQYCENMRIQYKNIKEAFLHKNASQRVAEIVIEMAGWKG
jgi:lipid-A-disaccharide synthase